MAELTITEGRAILLYQLEEEDGVYTPLGSDSRVVLGSGVFETRSVLVTESVSSIQSITRPWMVIDLEGDGTLYGLAPEDQASRVRQVGENYVTK